MITVPEGHRRRDGLSAEGFFVLRSHLASSAPEVQASAAELVLRMVREVPAKDYAMLATLLPSVLDALERFVLGAAAREEQLEVVLKALASATAATPRMFKASCFERLWPLLLQISSIPDFVDDHVRHLAMEAAMSLALGLIKDFCTIDGQPLLEEMVNLNVEWLLELELDVNRWNSEGELNNEDVELDEDTSKIGEDNLCALAEACSQLKGSEDTQATQLEGIFLPLLFKVLHMFSQMPRSTWRHARAAAVVVSRVARHIVEEVWLARCVEMAELRLLHAHPRVRHAGLQAMQQLFWSHSAYMQENHAEVLLPVILAGLADQNKRVAASAASTLGILIADMSVGALRPHVQAVIDAVHPHLSHGSSLAMKENCLSCLAAIGHVSEELSTSLDGNKMSIVKHMMTTCTSEQDDYPGKGQWPELAQFVYHSTRRRPELELARPVKRRRCREWDDLRGPYDLRII